MAKQVRNLVKWPQIVSLGGKISVTLVTKVIAKPSTAKSLFASLAQSLV